MLIMLIMLIKKVAQSCRLGNKAEFVQFGNMNQSKNLTLLTISRFYGRHGLVWFKDRKVLRPRTRSIISCSTSDFSGVLFRLRAGLISVQASGKKNSLETVTDSGAHVVII